MTGNVAVDLFAFEGEGGSLCDDGVMTSDKSELTWKVDVPQAGLYNIRLDYLTVESRGIDVERELAINGVVPFAGASTLSFPRLWTDSGSIRKDNQGNDIRPTQVERFEKQSAWCMDSLGYQTEPYAFYFIEGENTLTLKAVNEPVILCGITLTPPAKNVTYAEYSAAQPEAAMSEEAKNFSLKVQGGLPRLRRCSVRARVSIPAMPGLSCRSRKSASSSRARQLEAGLSSWTTSPFRKTPRDSMSSGEHP